MSGLRTIILLLILVTISGCGLDLFKNKKAEPPVARVNDKYLVRSDFIDATEGLNESDSIVVAKRFIDAWVKDQLILYRAEMALSDDQKDFDRQIEEYRKSLLIYSYRQKLLQQKLDTVINPEEIEAYYENNINSFLISQDIIKGTFVKISINGPRVNEVRLWSRTNSADALIELEKYCISYAEKYSDFNNNWIYFTPIGEQIPLKISRPSRYLRYNRNIEARDSLFRYFLHIADHKTEGDFAPIEMVSDDIRSILLNKRKIEFFHDLESRVYNDGLSKNQFEIY